MMKYFTLGWFLVLPFLTMGQSGVIATRLSRIDAKIPMSYNGHVETQINGYLRNVSQTEIMLGQSAVYLKAVEDSLKANKLPLELKFLMPSLSNYDAWKISEEGGSGYWQMRYIIARRYGLKISSYVDERRDYLAATSAAIQYLKALHKIYGDWLPAIAAFECDEVEVNKAMRMAGGQKNYWEFSQFLPARCQNVVPKFIASVYIHSYYDMHSLHPKMYKPVALSKVEIKQWTTIYQLSQALDMSYDSLKNFNPIFKRQVIPNSGTPYFISIPTSKLNRFNSLGDSVYTYKAYTASDVIVNTEPIEEVNLPQVHEPVQPETRVAPSNTKESGDKMLYYTVKKGDFLGKIADLYDVGISDVRRWNNIKGDRIDINQRLKIYVDAGNYDTYSKYNSYSAYQKQKVIDQD
ncbi:MAG: membrane-bound lytic murein transglycosylase D [Bacteroidia bacterium]|jgi:membrane-bound lytic murein transglycosylase D